MPIPPEVVRCYKHIDLNVKQYIEELKELVKIPSVSSDPNASKHLSHLIKWVSSRLGKLGFTILCKQPDYRKYKGNKPLIVIATLNIDPKKKTLLYYCHLDVLKARREQWKTDPFELTERDGKLYGRGTAKMKGPFLCFLHAVESYRVLGIKLPINIKMIIELMNECNSRGLNSVLDELKPAFLPSIDCVLLNESNWLGSYHPCIVYGMRGTCYFNLRVEGPCKDLPSGDFGGIVREPMLDVLYILNRIVDPYGKITTPHMYDDVVEVTPDEEEFYRKIKLDIKEFRANAGVHRFGHNEDLKSVLMHVWRYPWFNLHYIHGSCDNHNTLDISKQVLARFSLRIVPNQTHQKVTKLVLDHINDLTKQIKTPNKVFADAEQTLDPWCENHLHWNYTAANIATKQVYKEEANFIREGNGFPTVLKLRDALPKRNILILPIVNSEAKPHTEEENISIRCYIEGTKLLASYFYALHEVTRKSADVLGEGPRPAICRYRL